MTDKQEKIMLTTEVLNCDYFNRNRGFNCYKGKNCAEVPDCYYKQLKRKEQECEQKDKDIKYIIKCLDNSFKTQQDSELYWERERKKLKAEKEKLKQTLIEIKEIAKVEIECKTYEIENDCFNETRCKALNEHIDFTKQILQKLSEVENAR